MLKGYVRSRKENQKLIWNKLATEKQQNEVFIILCRKTLIKKEMNKTNSNISHSKFNSLIQGFEGISRS